MREQFDMSGCGLIPVGYDKHGPKYKKDDLDSLCEKMIVSETFFSRRNKVKNDSEKAIEQVEKVTSEFSIALSRFMAIEDQFVNSAKKASSDVRSASDKLAQGLAKIEKTANFSNLERYVVLLERAAAAMSALAELESSGKLEKIANAIK